MRESTKYKHVVAFANVLELKSKAESELRSEVQSLKPKEAAVLALLRGRLAKEAEHPASKKQRATA